MIVSITPKELLNRVPGTANHDPACLAPVVQEELAWLAAVDRPHLARFLHSAAKLAVRRAAKLPQPITPEAALKVYGNLVLALFLVPAPMLESVLDDWPPEIVDVFEHFSNAL